METVSVFVYYDGLWDQYRNYNDYSIVGLSIPLDCSYTKLVDMIMTELKQDQTTYAVTIHYQLLANGPLIKICSDTSMYFYIQVKKNETDLTKFTMCVDTEKVVCNEDNLTHLGNENSGSNASKNTFTSSSQLLVHGCLHNSLIPRIPTIEDMGNEICENSKCDGQYVEENNFNIIMRPGNDHIKKNAIFKNKELLTTSVTLYAIHYRYQLKVYKSDKNEYVLKCLDDNCKWGLRASILQRTTMFKIRSIKNSHTCSLDVTLGDHRQATCSVIANCIKYKFDSARTIYTPNDIVQDMMRMYGVTISYEKAWRARERAL
ncbi:Uncharacterized protein Adt_40430 [Abeliophyllum distichum]|uniref:Transposase MuDR plant domain-containing protein n=1 Tax=Abeliophyllum distichum TaxID=126358 RepID=A0ABD1Q7W9_9LAMI